MAKKTFASTIIAPILNGISSIFGKDDDEEEKKRKEEEERKNKAQGKTADPAPVKKTYTIADSSPLAPITKNTQQKTTQQSNTQQNKQSIAPIAVYSATSPMNEMQWRTDTVPGMTETIKDNIQPTFFKEGSGSAIDKILGTAADAAENVATGFLSFGESAVDSLLTLGSNLGKANLAQANFNMTYSPYAATKKGRETASGIVATNNALQKKSDETVSNVIKSDIINEQQIAQKYITKPFEENTGINAQKASVIGEMGAKALQSAGQLVTQVGLTALGVPSSLSIGLSSFGGEMENALKQGATLEEATVSSMISATGEILSERLSGGIKLGGKTLDEKILDPFIDKISNDVVRNIVNIGADAFGEGLEEIFSGVISNFGSALYKEESIGTLINSAEARKEYVESFLIGSLLGGTSSTAKATINTVSDIVIEKKENKLTSNEQKVVDTEIESRMKELEDSGEKVKRSKVHKEVMKDLEEGLISIDTIERALGGETYKRYKEAVDNEAAVKDEFDILNKMKQGDMTGEQSDRRNELKKQLEEMNNSTVTADLKKQLGDEVFNISKSTRLEESYREAERGKQAFTADLSKYDEKQSAIVKAAIESGVLNNTNKSHRFVDFVAKICADKGITFDFTNNRKLQESAFAVEGRDVSGYVVGNNVTINVSSKRMLNSVVGHEVMHVLKGTDLYVPLTEALTAYSKSIGEYSSRLENTAKLYEGMDADINEELFADMVGDYIFSDEDFVRKLSTENRNVFEKVYDEIKYLCKTATTASDDGRQLLKAKKLFEEMYREEVDIKNTTDEGGVKYSFGVTQNDINKYVDDAYDKINTEDYKKYAEASEKLISDVSDEIDITGYCHALRDNDIRHIKNSHGEGTNEKYPVTSEDIKQIPMIIENYDKVFVKTNTSGKPGIVYVKVTSDNTVYYVEAITEEYHNEKLLVNKQMIKTGFGEIPNLYGLISAINKKESSSQYLADLEKIRKAYVQDVKGNYYDNSISNSADNVKKKQLEIIEKVNPAPDTYHTWVRSVEDIKTLSEALEDSEWADYDEFIPDLTRDMIEEAIESGKITVYSSYPIEQGVFVSPSYMEAESYSGTGKVYEKTVNIEDVAWLDPTQGMYANINADVSSKANNNVKDNNADYSLSAPVSTDTKRRARDIYGDDVSLDTSENIAPVREDVKKADSTENVKAAATEQKKIAPVKEDLKASDKDKKFTTLDIIDDDAETEVKTEEAKVKSEEAKVKSEDVKGNLLNRSATSFGITKPGDYVQVQRKVFDTLKNEGFFSDNENRSRTVTNLDSSMQVEINKSGIFETFSLKNYGNLGRRKKAIKLAVVRNLPEIIQNGKLISDNTDNYHNKESSVKFAYIESTVEIDGQNVSVKVDIKKSPQKNKFWVHSIKISEKANGFPADASKVLKQGNEHIGTEEIISDTKQNVKSEHSKLSYKQAKADPLKKFENRTRKVYKVDKELLTEEFKQKRAELIDELKDKTSFISNGAAELYAELSNLKKGVKASYELGKLLDTGHSWSELKSTLLKVSKWPDAVINPDSEVEQTVRDALNKSYEDKLFELEDIDNEYERQLEKIDADVQEKIDKFKIVNKRIAKQQELQSEVKNLIGDTSTWKDKKIGLQYAVNTLRRNLRDIVRNSDGKKDIAKADAIYDFFGGEYNKNHAQLNREANEILDRFREYKITSAEDKYIQMLGELRHNPDSELTPDTVNEFYEKHKKEIDVEKVDEIIIEARKLYDELLLRTNEVLSEYGMRKIPYRKGYFPHFNEAKQGKLAKLLNWKTQNNEIPTSIAGITEQFKPVRSWQSFDKTRTSDDTIYSFTRGLDSYVNGSLDWIYHMGDIQKRRAFENLIRYEHSDKGIKEKIDAIRNNEEYDADEMQEQINLVFREAKNPLNNFVQDFTTATNTLANKKSSFDREVERYTNRKIYSTMTNLSNRVSGNLVAGSISAALTNFIPITQSWVQVSPVSSLRAMSETISSVFEDDGIVEKSNFLTNRLSPAENLYKTKWDKVGEKVSWLMDSIDNFTSQTVWRSKYNENLSNGMSEIEAVKNADQFAENVMAGRSKGNMPTLFDAKNPIIKAITTFQVEVNNQYGYMLKDVPTDMANEAKIKLIKGYATAFIGAYAYNALYSTFAGRDAALDPIGIIEDLLHDLGVIGDENIFEEFAEAIGLFIEDDEEEEEIEPVNAVFNFTDNIIDELPFLGSFTGGGRIPLSSALPYDGIYTAIKNTASDLSEKNYLTLTKEWLKPVFYLLMPMGGGQLKKTIEGLQMFSDKHPISGSYTDSGNLRFPVDKTPGNVLQAAVFGQYANENAREYFDEGYAPLKEKQIQEYIDVDMPISEYREYREGLSGLKTLNEKGDYIGGLKLPVSKKNILINNIAGRDEPIDMTDYKKYKDFEEFDFAQRYPDKYKVLKEQDISVKEYKEEYQESTFMYTDDFSWAANNPDKYAISKVVAGDVLEYKKYTSELSKFEADKDKNGESINGTKKKKQKEYIFDLPLEYGQKIILYRSLFSSKEDKRTYNNDIIDYLESREDLSYEDKVAILTELDFTVDENGYVKW